MISYLHHCCKKQATLIPLAKWGEPNPPVFSKYKLAAAATAADAAIASRQRGLALEKAFSPIAADTNWHPDLIQNGWRGEPAAARV